MDRYNYSFTCDEDQALLDMFNFFDDVGIPDHMDQEAYDSLQQKFFANVPAWLLQKRQHHLQHLHVGDMTKITSTSKVGVFFYTTSIILGSTFSLKHN